MRLSVDWKVAFIFITYLRLFRMCGRQFTPSAPWNDRNRHSIRLDVTWKLLSKYVTKNTASSGLHTVTSVISSFETIAVSTNRFIEALSKLYTRSKISGERWPIREQSKSTEIEEFDDLQNGECRQGSSVVSLSSLVRFYRGRENWISRLTNIGLPGIIQPKLSWYWYGNNRASLFDKVLLFFFLFRKIIHLRNPVFENVRRAKQGSLQNGCLAKRNFIAHLAFSWAGFLKCVLSCKNVRNVIRKPCTIVFVPIST